MENEPDSDQRLYSHLTTILSLSGAMVGVCLTVISVLGISKSLSKTETMIDDIMAANSLIFMVAGLLSFLGMRTRFVKAWRGLTTALDIIFSFGLVLMVVVAGLLAIVVL